MSKILPPILVLALTPLMLALNYVPIDSMKTLHTTGIPSWEIGATVMFGLAFLIAARIQFVRADAEIMTFNTPRNLVTTGIYRVSRNPMYLGFLLLLVGLALYVNLWQALIGPIIFFLAAQYWYIPVEEQAAKDAFGESYVAYKKKVRRWI